MREITDDPEAASVGGAAAVSHPRGLYTLFFTEMWERFSYYGMRALLVLFMVDAVEKGGLGLTDGVATAIYGLYTAGVYLAALPGGWVADRFLGARRSVWFGGMVIALGHFTLAIPRVEAFYLGLGLVVCGTGLLKPNISAIVAGLYPAGGARRDAGFTLFYMGINLGATLGPLVCSTLGEKFNWHWGFAAAGVGMLLGLVQFRCTEHWLGGIGRRPGAVANRFDRGLLVGGGVGAALLVLLLFGGGMRLNPIAVARVTAWLILALALAYFVGLLLLGGLTRQERRRVGVIAVLFVASAVFWSGFEQAGSSLNLFADRFTDRVFRGVTVPAGWFQSLNPAFIITLAPLVAWFWTVLARRRTQPPLAVKFGAGLLLLAAGFLVMAWASWRVAGGRWAAPSWLISTYLLHSVGELFLSPVGLSSVTKLAPARYLGQMMGVWFLATSLGNLLAGLVAGEFAGDSLVAMSGRYLQIVAMVGGAGVVVLAMARPIRRWSEGVE
jgi:POT family proton-dependent oligopeptide transporter